MRVMQAAIDHEICIECEMCVEMCPEVFSLLDNRVQVIIDPIPQDKEDISREAQENCPVDAIQVS